MLKLKISTQKNDPDSYLDCCRTSNDADGPDNYRDIWQLKRQKIFR